jgi:hypothetical protein
MRTIIGTVIVAITIGASVTAFAQKIEIGMTKAQLAKAYPRYDSEFKTSQSYVNVENFRLHGLRGLAMFHFSNDHLILFDWTYPNDYHPGAMFMMQPKEVNKYDNLVHALQSDWGSGKTRQSPYNQDAIESSWDTPKFSASTSYSPMQVKVQLMDLSVLRH